MVIRYGINLSIETKNARAMWFSRYVTDTPILSPGSIPRTSFEELVVEGMWVENQIEYCELEWCIVVIDGWEDKQCNIEYISTDKGTFWTDENGKWL